MIPNAATLQALGAALAGGDPEAELSRALRAFPTLSSSERAEVARDVLGAACHRSRLRAFVEAAGLEVSPLNVLLAFRIRQVKQAADDGAAELGVTVESARALAMCAPIWPSDVAERLALQESLPLWLARLWLEEWREAEAFALAAATNTPGPVTLRANLLQGTPESIAARLAAEGIVTARGKHSPTALHVQGRANLFGSAAWREGAFEVQDEASQMVIDVCAPKPGERWLDLCAGSGGKTLGLAAEMGNRGELWAAGIDAQQRDNLRARLRRSGAQARVVELDPRQPEAALGREKFDGVLVDAPCSELGTLRRHIGARWRLTPQSIEPLPALQRRLVAIALDHLVPTGRVVYATCTLRRAENEEVVGPGWVQRTLLPHREGTDGFFIARRPSCAPESALK